MKKIFAIALALVMVLSMASAFAAASMPGTCDWGTWDCTTYTSNCGVAHAEVVKFVRTNDCDPFVESDCAGVVIGEHVYFGVKVVFDKDVNVQWLKHANTKLTVKTSKTTAATAIDDKVSLLGALVAGNSDWGSSTTTKDIAKYVSGKTYWFNGTALVEEFSNACVYTKPIADSTGVKVCANVEYDFDGKTGAVDFGKYTVEYVAASSTAPAYLEVTDVATNDVASFFIIDGKVNCVGINGKVYNAYVNNTFYGWDSTYNKFAADADTCMFLQAMMGFLKINIGDCVTDDGIKAFLGWDDDDAFKVCTTWSKNASAIVDAECVVAIPKTGDASVLAWLF